MTSILSAISGSFSRALLLGTLFPVTVFALLSLLFVFPFLPPDAILLAPLVQLDPGWKTALFTLSVILVTGLLYNLNVALIRLYEGYPWRRSWLGRWASAREGKRLEWARKHHEELPALISRLRAIDPNDPRIEQLDGWRPYVGQRVRNEFPGAALVLPTRLGNVIRSFEEYPREVYGISAITVWPRLVGVVEKEYITSLDESKASLDFMVNASFLSGALSLSVLGAGLMAPARIEWTDWLAQWVLPGFAARLFYLGALGQAAAWGTQVKGAFDLYRWPLLAKLGYARPALDAQSERALWENISRRMLYGNPPDASLLLPYVPAKPPEHLILTDGDAE